MQNPGINFVPSTSTIPGFHAMSSNLFNPSTISSRGRVASDPLNEIVNATPPSLLLFLAGLPAVNGPIPDVDTVLSICLQSNIPAKQTAITPMTQTAITPMTQTAISGTRPAHPVPSTTHVSSSEKSRVVGAKRKYQERQDNDQTTKVKRQSQVMDVFKFRQIQKARTASSQSGSTSYSSSYSSDLSSST